MSSAPWESRYLRPQDLRLLGRLFFSSRKVIDGRYAGRHASPRRGRSVEFNDHRAYSPGDSPADVDWKVLGRSDKLFVRLSEHQADMSVHLLVDASASMAYAGVPANSRAIQANEAISKFDYACRMAAAIAFLALRQRDQVSLGLAQGRLTAFLPPAGTPRHLRAMLDVLEAAAPAGVSGLDRAVREMGARIGARIGRRGVVVVLSDLLDSAQPVLDALSLLAHRGHEVILLHVLHAQEIDLPDLANAVFIDSETGQRLPTDTTTIREEYAAGIRQFQQGWAAACRPRGFDYRFVSTAMSYHRALEDYLFARAEGE